MEVRGADHAADEVLATTATPEPASGVHQVLFQAAQEPVAAGEGEQDQVHLRKLMTTICLIRQTYVGVAAV